jgi:iron(III) transport system ATP-binding protein
MLGGVTLSLPHRGAQDGPAELAVRPHSVQLGASDGLPGKIAKAAYLGSHMEYEVAIEGVAEEVFVIGLDVATPYAAGQAVSVAFDPAGLAVVPRE